MQRPNSIFEIGFNKRIYRLTGWPAFIVIRLIWLVAVLASGFVLVAVVRTVRDIMQWMTQ
jgi:hypothetical protein